MGPTLILPGSHLRDVAHDISRYRNIAGQKHLSGPGGRIAFIHDAIWHCAQPNLTDQPRFMFKVRYHPAEPQREHFDATGWDSLEMWRLFRDNVNRHAWQGSSSDRIARPAATIGGAISAGPNPKTWRRRVSRPARRVGAGFKPAPTPSLTIPASMADDQDSQGLHASAVGFPRCTDGCGPGPPHPE